MIEKLRKLIANYCRENSEEILKQICEVILSVEEIEYTEFVAFRVFKCYYSGTL